MLNHLNFTENARFIIPLFMYAMSLLIALSIRRDIVHLWTRDLPRLGSEFCKIACALFLGALALGFSFPPLNKSWLGRRADREALSALVLVLLVVLFTLSYSCLFAIEGKRTWRGEMKLFPWLAGWLASQSFGLMAIWIAIRALRGEG
jgi:hypothetical protein